MLSLQEIKPRQIRALLLLLMLAPLIPTGLLLRFMFDTVQQERESARDTISTAWQDSLSIAVRALKVSLKQEIASAPDPQKAAEIIGAALQRSFDHAISIRLLAENGRVLSGEASSVGNPIATAPIEELLPGARIELSLAERNLVQQAVQEQVDSYTRTAVYVIGANMLIALAAGGAFFRQIKTQELKTGSLATLAHELRTPVASMRLLLDTIREGRCPDQAEYLELLARENTRLSRLVDQFLTHSRLELGHAVFVSTPVDVLQIVAQAEENLRSRLQAPGTQYHRQSENDLPNILGDAPMIACLLENLLDNAWKYTGAEKDIALEIGRRAGGVAFTIRDNGSGIAPAEQRSIFDRFHRVDNRLARTSEGCGLGLHIARRIVETHRGRLRVESQLGQGSRFIVWLPAA